MYDPGLLYVDPILTQFSVGFQDQELIGRQIMPEVPLRTQSGKYNVFDRSSWMIYEDARAPGTHANEVQGRKWSTDVFETREHSLQVPIHDEERQQLTSQGGLADPVFGGAIQIDPEVDATELVTGAILLGHEKAVSDLIRNTSNYPVANTITRTSTAQWDSYTYGTAGIPETVVSDPISDILVGMRVIYNATRRWPNTLVIPTLGLSFIENHPRVINRFKNFSLAIPEAFRVLTGFQGQVLLAQSAYNAANNIDAAESITDLWGKDVWLGIVDPTPALKTKTFGKTFAQVYPNGTTRPTDKWREEGRKSDIIRTSYKYDLKIVSSIAGYLIKTAFSSGAW